ncbi:ATP-binding protein [uncultured Phascolarctobacterium sp.]|uniref:ATP-binding protein n=1 Tax=uncultured Phascolarctobacterium sp. TaxID=512296 RepID=UPI0025D7981A|nr:ATP-binding protein [uncultured Phascolarctobacterium sp.]
MQIQDFIILIYIILRIVPSSYLCYYPFLEDLRLSKKVAMCGFFAIILIEWGIFIFTGHNFDKLSTLYGIYPLYIFYYFATVKGNNSKQLFCILLTGNFDIVLQTLAMLAERFSPTPGYYYATATFVLLLAQSAYFSLFYYAAKKFKQLFRSTKYNNIITYSNYILAFNFVALVLIRNFSEPRTWNLFFARFLCAMPLFFFVYMMMDLLKEKNDNNVMSVKLSSLEELRRNEKPYYDFVIETWQKSRRLRHDQKHLLVMLNQLYEEKKFDRLGQHLRAILKYTEQQQTVKLYGNETIDGLIGYWQMQAQEKGIPFAVDISFSKIKINDIDLAIILGNALENAFTAVTEDSVTQRSNCYINVKIRERASILLIEVVNSFSGNIVRYNDQFYSAKRNYKEPGTGLENIRMICEKYAGSNNVSFDNQSFKLQLMLSNTHLEG